jgi:hypothetical protein
VRAAVDGDGTLLEQVSFDASNSPGKTIVVDAAYVNERGWRAQPGRRSVALHPVIFTRCAAGAVSCNTFICSP